MPSDTRPAIQQNNRHLLHVAIYEHPHGMDVRVFASEELALDWRTGLGREWWSSAFDDDPPPDHEIGAEYFERMQERDEFSSIQICALETGCPTPDGEGLPKGAVLRPYRHFGQPGDDEGPGHDRARDRRRALGLRGSFDGEGEGGPVFRDGLVAGERLAATVEEEP